MSFFSNGTPCPRCGYPNPKGKASCEHCGISLAFIRPAILVGNAWQPALDELAVVFRFKQLKGFCTKTLHVPAGMKAWMLQDDPNQPVRLLDEGTHTAANLFQLMNNFFRTPQGEVLVVKTSSVPVNFVFDKPTEDKLTTLEGLALKASLTLRLRVRVGEDPSRPDLAAFRRHFMQLQGVVTAQQLSSPELLGTSVKTALRSYLAARNVDELLANHHLATDLDTHLRNQLGALLADLGLELLEPTEFNLHHEKLDAQHHQQGELWLLRRDQQKLQQDHQRALNDLYDATERESLRTREQEIRRKFLAGTLDQEEADLAYALRLREVTQLERLLQADTREQAAKLGASDALKALEHGLADKRRQREQASLGAQYQADDQRAEWDYIQQVARIQRDLALKQLQAKAALDLTLQTQRADNEVRCLRAVADLEHAKHIADLSEREEALRQSLDAMARCHVRSEQLKETEHQIYLDNLHNAATFKQRETERVQALDEALLAQKVNKIRRDDAAAASANDLGELTGLADLAHKLNKDKIEIKQQEARIKQDEEDRATNRQLQARQQEHEHALERNGRELEQLRLTAGFPAHALVLYADNPAKLDALVKIHMLEKFSTMTPEGIDAAGKAMRPGPAAGSGGPELSATAQEERLRNEREAVQRDERLRAREEREHSNAQLDKLLGHISQATNAVRDMGLAVASGNRPPLTPTVVVAHVPGVEPMPAATPTSASAIQPLAHVTCPHCRALNRAGGRYCTSCGQPLA